MPQDEVHQHEGHPPDLLPDELLGDEIDEVTMGLTARRVVRLLEEIMGDWEIMIHDLLIQTHILRLVHVIPVLVKRQIFDLHYGNEIA